jgi:hypothetical protein
MRYKNLSPVMAKDTPMRLSRAAQLAFPDGSVSAATLRKEAKRGRLVVERICGRDYTTLQHVEEMRKRCRVEPKAFASTSESASGQHEKASGSSSTGMFKSARDAAMMTAQKLRKRSEIT